MFTLSRRALLGLTLLFNLPFVLFQVQRTAFDTYVHIFLADHYQTRWWNLWEPRWYMGFSVASYPPLVHQLTALLAWPFTAVIQFFAPSGASGEPFPDAFRWLGQETAFVALLLTVLCAFPFAVRAFARGWVGPPAANVAALGAIFLPGLHLTAWAFGQLPTLAGTTVLLFALAQGGAFVRTGDKGALLRAVTLASLVGALHHAVFLFAPFAGGAVVLRELAIRWGPHPRPSATPSPDAKHQPLPEGRLLRQERGMGGEALVKMLGRALVWGTLSALGVALTLWPFLLWSRGQTLQVPIDHASRHNFFQSPTASLFFFWPMYGALVLALPLLWRWRRLRALSAATLLLFVLGLGGTTPLPAYFFGAGWEWLTYDRFALWAGTLLLVFFGAASTQWRHTRVIKFFWPLLIASACVAGWWSVLTRSQPAPLDLAPLVRFLNQRQQLPYRYLTLGFGDQFVKLSTLSAAASLDGDYHTARAIPALRQSGLGALDTARWNARGVTALLPFLRHPERYGLRWVFVNHIDYVRVLAMTGWRFRGYAGTVAMWDHRDTRPVSVAAPPGLKDSFAARWWGSAPLAVLLASALTFAPALKRWRLTRSAVTRGLAVARNVCWAAFGGLSGLWWFHAFHLGTARYVYFVYQSELLFASDVALLLGLSLWALERLLRREPLHFGPRGIALGGALLIGACGLSIFPASDKLMAFALTVHLLFLALVYLALINDPPPPLMWGAVSAGMIFFLAVIALAQVWSQQTWSMNLPWPGALEAATSGASVAQNAAGARWLRAYGTLPHPNILGGVMLILLTGVTACFIQSGRKRWLLVSALGWLTVWLTFSRAAWLGAGAFFLSAGLGLRGLARQRLFYSAFTAGLPALCVIIALWPFFQQRATLTPTPAPLEQKSHTDREHLTQASFDLMRAHPLLGVGAGNFVLKSVALPALIVEPVHNLLLLILAETGLPGGLACLIFVSAILGRLWRRRATASPREILWGATLIGLGVIALFDHYWWTQAPMRALAVWTVAQWVAESARAAR